MSILFALLFAAAPVQQDWAFVPEAGPIPYIHVVRDGVDLGRAAPGTYYDGPGSTFVADSLFHDSFGG